MTDKPNRAIIIKLRESIGPVVQFKELEQAIRLGTHPDRPDLLYRYVSAIAVRANKYPECSRHLVYERLFNTLMNTISDPLVKSHWRQLCLDNINRPLRALEALAKTETYARQLRRCYAELNLLARYNLD